MSTPSCVPDFVTVLVFSAGHKFVNSSLGMLRGFARVWALYQSTCADF
jgi:hypothetical protein